MSSIEIKIAGAHGAGKSEFIRHASEELNSEFIFGEDSFHLSETYSGAEYDTQAIIVMFDMSDSESFKTAVQIVQELQNTPHAMKTYPGRSVVLCGNKHDKMESYIDLEKINDFVDTNGLRYYSTNCINGLNVVNAIQTVLQPVVNSAEWRTFKKGIM